MKTLIAALGLAAWLAPSPPPSDGWLLVRGHEELAQPLTYRRIAELYLKGESVRIAESDGARDGREPSRMLVGTPADNPLLAELLPELGVAVEPDALVYRGHRIGPERGLVIVRDDVDGNGTLSVLTGVRPQGVFACFTVMLDIRRAGFTIVERNTKIAVGDVTGELDTSRPIVVRLDVALERLLADAAGWSAGEAELHAARGLAGYAFVFRAAGGEGYVTERHVRSCREDRGDRATYARRFFASTDVTARILEHYEWLSEIVARDGPAPVFYVLNDPEVRTNGKTFDADPVTGRPSVLFNLAALAGDGSFDTIVLHEGLHTFQAPDPGPTRVVDRGMREGAATLGTQLVSTIGGAAALLWTEEQLAAAEARRDAIVSAFRRDAASTDPALLRAWFTLDVDPPVAGAPSRSGYFVMWLAARAWMEANPDAGVAELLAAAPDEVLAALD